jgi:hypothetical protein
VTAPAWIVLLVVDLAIAVGGLPYVHRLLSAIGVWRNVALSAALKGRATNAATQGGATDAVVLRVNRAIARAAVWYPRTVRCLPRSAAATWLLRWLGQPAVLVIGIRTMPFYAHAWVELEGRVVNDLAEVSALYPAIDRIEPRQR